MPETIAIIAPVARARCGSPAEMGSTTARITAASAESGPRIRIRLGPKSAYASSGTIVPYRPLIPGSPDASAYAMPTGTSIVVMTRPATTSRPSQDDSYERSVWSPGNQRVTPARSACNCRRWIRPRSGPSAGGDAVIDEVVRPRAVEDASSAAGWADPQYSPVYSDRDVVEF